jgi:nucleotide-binding universal stress UspA family protein
MENKRPDKKQTDLKGITVLVAVVVALRRARTILGQKPGRILVLHVIDQDFIVRCIHNRLGTEEHIKKTLYLRAKAKLKDLLLEEGLGGHSTEELICEGTPFIMGNRGNSGDMETIFFGSTAERVLRFMKRPVLCVPLEEDQD